MHIYVLFVSFKFQIRQETVSYQDDYSIQGKSKVQVEVRDGSHDAFGHGRKQTSTFADVVRKISAGDARFYLTTQEPPLGPDGYPEIWASPVSLLAADLPLRPKLFGDLVPQSINIWMGCAPQGASSGLHHDYHDNLYVLLRGRKRFRLYPPSMAPLMATQGNLVGIYPNGRIVYENQGDILPDGSDAKEVKAWRKKWKAEKELAEAEEAVARGDKGAKARLEVAERALDHVLESALDDEFDIMHDDFEELDEANKPSSALDSNSNNKEPESFSKIDLSLPMSQLRKKFPSFPGVDAALECEVRAGESLYLPAGWFHEVTSWDLGDSRGHLALNYWFHPPDNFGEGGGLAKPYKSEYWPELWASRESRFDSTKGERNTDDAVGLDEGNKHVGQPSSGAKAMALHQLQGFFGWGRRQHLYRFITFRVKE